MSADMIAILGLLTLGLLFLVIGAESLVKGASRLARIARVSPLVVGLVIVSYGTSAPEMVVSVKGALMGQSDIAMGNVVGSNIFNVLLILGLSATIVPLAVSQQLIRLDVPIMIAVSLAAIAMGFDGSISRWEGIALVAGLILYTVFVVRNGLKESNPQVKDEYDLKFSGNGKRNEKNGGVGIPVGVGQVFLQIGWVIGGLGLLILGARWFVDGSISLARAFGVSELVIGLTIVAAGTSMPEVATSIVAAIRGERDIAVGNVVGSNIFNILAVLGVSALCAPAGISVSPALLNFDMPVMLAVAVACLPIFFTGNTIARWEGMVFLGYYVAYVAYLLLQSWQHDHLDAFSHSMLVFVVPITGLTLLLLAYRQHHHNQNQRRTA